MQRLISSVFARCGQTVKLQGEPVRAIFQKGHSRSLQSLERVFVPLGEIPRGQYVCYLPGDTPVNPGDTLQTQAGTYRVCRAEAMAFPGGRILYKWALCARKGGEVL